MSNENANLPAVITRFDEAGGRAASDQPPLTAVRGETTDCRAALVLGEGNAQEMDESGAWIQMDKWTAYDENDPRRLT